MKTLKRKLLLLFGLAAITGTFPYYGYSQREIPKDPRTFIDVNTGEAIENVLVIPRFSSSVGISSGYGHGPGWGSDSMYIAHPFTYRAGTNFIITQERSAGFSVGFFMVWMGWGHSTNGAVVIAPRYKPLWIWDLWGSFDHFKHELVSLPAEEVLREATAIYAILDKEWIEGSQNEIRWSVGNGLRIAVDLNEQDKTLVRSFIGKTSPDNPD